MFNYNFAHLTRCLANFGAEVAFPELAEQALHKLTNDSRSIAVGDVFCAVIGQQQDGRKYSERAVQAGAACIISECIHPQQHGKTTQLVINDESAQTVPVIHFYRLNEQLFALAQQYYAQPQTHMTMIGVTGTNGKTSTCLLIAKLFSSLQQTSAVIGTIGAGIIEQTESGTERYLRALNNTTPGATELNQLLAEFAEQQVINVAMEVSSHALVQKRLAPRLINIAVFTNLTRDHLDFHQTMEQYAAAKRMLFTGQAEQVAILNGDQPQSIVWLESWPVEQPVIVFGRGENIVQYPQFIQASNINCHATGVDFTLNSHLGSVEITSPLLGEFNVDNLLAAISVLLAKQQTLAAISSAVSCLTPIIGRMEKFTAAHKPTAVVDYAHTPDALTNAIHACRAHCRGELWLVFGCGGDRDQGKRELMGTIAEQQADHVVITNDNPRTEAPEMIAQAILRGCQHPERMTIILDRKQAVISTLSKAKAGDIVLLAGKGHEQYILIGDKKLPYNERAVVAQYYNQEAWP